MKHFLLFSLVLLAWLRPTPAAAQSSGSDSLHQKLTSIFAHIDKSQVPTGYLYEAGVRFLEPRYFNGVLADSNLTDMDVLRYLRAQMASSLVYGTDTLPNLPAFNVASKGRWRRRARPFPSPSNTCLTPAFGPRPCVTTCSR